RRIAYSELIQFSEQLLQELLVIEAVFQQQHFQALLAEALAFRVWRLRDAVGMEQKPVVALEAEGLETYFRRFEITDRWRGGCQFEDLRPSPHQPRDLSCIDIAHGERIGIDDAEEQGGGKVLIHN